jgi:hypothetical protein
MNTVYKYCDNHGVSVLRNLEFKITPPNQFNDPFEFTPRIICSDPHSYAKRILRNKAHIKDLYERLIRCDGFVGSFRQFREHVRSDRPEMVRIMARGVPIVVADVQKEHLDRVSERFGVLCMSKLRDSILMWGHYCDKHRGMVIGFDSSSEELRREKGLRAVSYVKERVLLDVNWKPGSTSAIRYEDELVFSKNEDWRYEQELRALFRLSKVTERPLQDGGVGYFLPFSPTALVSVSLGAKCSAEFERTVESALRAGPFSHVKVDRAVLHDTDFALEFI